MPGSAEGQLAPRGRLPVGHRLAMGAKLLASALFVSHRTRDDAWRESIAPRLGRSLAARTAVDVDETIGRVALRADEETRSARHLGDLGVVIDPADGEVAGGLIGFEVRADPAPGFPLDNAPNAAILEALDPAFEPPAHTAAMIVVHEGRVVAERYAPGIHADTQLESWSMGKSVAASLVGRAVAEGALDLDAPPLIPAWRRPGDERGAITLHHLLQMSSGLRFSAADDWNPHDSPVPDHVRIYMESLDTAAFATNRPLEHRPGTVGRYRNCDPLALLAILRLGADDATWWRLPQRELFDPIGTPRQVVDVDRAGGFIITGFDSGTARGWARLGLLWLNDGVVGDRRLLPEGFVSAATTPAPAWPQPVYGYQCWLNRTGEWALPDDAYSFAGDGTQRTFTVPSLDLVIVRLGHTAGTTAAGPALNTSLGRIAAATGRARAFS
jgi:CubicO group peptidase (beta-lactamase class C family)